MGDAQIPKQAAAWVVKGTSGFDDLVKEERSIPELGEYDVLVNLKGASLNYRDLIIPQVQPRCPRIHTLHNSRARLTFTETGQIPIPAQLPSRARL
jgi:hypothetical protein